MPGPRVKGKRSSAVQLRRRYGVDCQIKWPNDLLLNGKKIVGILCESVSYGYQMQGRGIVCGPGTVFKI